MAGGTGSRLRPVTSFMNKHLIPVGRHPMIHYAVQKLKRAGIADMLLVTDKQSAGLYAEYLGSGAQWGANLTYKIQEQAGGIAQALLLAEGFAGNGEKFIVLLGDNLFEDDLGRYAEEFTATDKEALIFLKAVEDPRRYGVPVFHQGCITGIVEKPEHPPSSYCVTGIYMYDSHVFEVIRKIAPSPRGEMEITDVNNCYAKEGRLRYRMLSGWWTDAGTFDSLYEANRKLRHCRDK